MPYNDLPTRQTGDGEVMVELGDLYSQEVRKVLMKFKIPALAHSASPGSPRARLRRAAPGWSNRSRPCRSASTSSPETRPPDASGTPPSAPRCSPGGADVKRRASEYVRARSVRRRAAAHRRDQVPAVRVAAGRTCALKPEIRAEIDEVQADGPDLVRDGGRQRPLMSKMSRSTTGRTASAAGPGGPTTRVPTTRMIPDAASRASRPLTGYDTKRCQRRVHNDHDPTSNRCPGSRRLTCRHAGEGRAFEADIFATLRQALPPERWRNLSGLPGREAVVDATVAAMDERVELILGGRLPDDESGGRTDDLTSCSASTTATSPATEMAQDRPDRQARHCGTRLPARRRAEVEGLAPVTTGRIEDYLQLGHYWRMLEASRQASGAGPRGFIIGTDQLTQLAPSGVTLTWLDLDEPLFTSFSRSRGTAKALERYDFEHGIRLDIARVARAGPVQTTTRTRSSHRSSPPSATPAPGTTTATSSPASPPARTSAPAASTYASGAPWTTSASPPSTTSPTSTPTTPGSRYLPEVTHHGEAALSRLTTVIRRANMIRDGVPIQRETTGPVHAPRRRRDRLRHRGRRRVRLPVGSPGHRRRRGTVLPGDHQLGSPRRGLERALAQAFVDWLRDIRDRAAAEGRTVLAYHYTSYEPEALRRILGPDAVADVLELFADLYAIVAAHYFGAAGLGLKKVACIRVPLARRGTQGLLSQLWYLDATQTEDADKAAAAKARLLAYNEDDVLAVREGIQADADGGVFGDVDDVPEAGSPQP